MKYRDAIRKAITEWEKGGLFRSKSSESQNAVDAMKTAMSDPLDGQLSGLVNWLVGYVIQVPPSFSYLQPIKDKCKLRTLLNAALLEGDPPMLKVKASSSVSASSARRQTQVAPQITVKPKTVVSGGSGGSNSNASSSSATIVKPSVVVSTPSSSSSKPPSISIQPSVSSQPQIVIAPPPQVQKHLRHLILDCCERSGGTVDAQWSQASIFGHLGIPEDLYNGFCASAVGRWFADEANAAKLKTQKGKIDTLLLHESYRASKKASYVYMTEALGLPFVDATEATALTAENLFKQLETFKGTRHMIGLLKHGGGGHAIGVWQQDAKYKFFDANEGLVTLPNRQALWTFIWYYVTDVDQGLAKDYTRCFVATWK
ncbi:MAG TPA: hypothetical protein VF618_23560 [Thermoanaerobaculia bacterium]